MGDAVNAPSRPLTATDVLANVGLNRPLPHYICAESDGRRFDRQRLPQDTTAEQHRRRWDTAHVQHEFEEDEETGRIVAALTVVIPQGVQP